MNLTFRPDQVTCQIPGCQLIVNQALETLHEWDWWSCASKIFTCVFGGLIAALGIAVVSKEMPGKWHWIVSAVFAAGAFTMGVLQPYEEYKQFRDAYATLENGLLTFAASKRGEEDLKSLIAAQAKGRAFLKETWASPSIEPTTGVPTAPTIGSGKH